MILLLMGIVAFFGRYPWLLLPVLVGGLSFDAWNAGGRRYLQFHRQRQQMNPREGELLKASHGVAVLAICGLGLATLGPDAINRFLAGLSTAPNDPWHFGPALAFAGLVLWGVTWTLSGVNRSLAYAGFRDSRLINRAILKIPLAAALWWLFRNPPPGWPPDLLTWIAWAQASLYARFAVEAVITWLVTTALVKVALLLWQRHSTAKGDVETDIRANEFDWKDFQ